jgi:hypothetical protein
MYELSFQTLEATERTNDFFADRKTEQNLGETFYQQTTRHFTDRWTKQFKVQKKQK